MRPTLLSLALPAAGALMLGGLLLVGPSARAAPAAPVAPTLDSKLVQPVHYNYCRRWYAECRYRWGAGWRFRRCMNIHGC